MDTLANQADSITGSVLDSEAEAYVNTDRGSLTFVLGGFFILFELIYIGIRQCKDGIQKKKKEMMHEEISKYFVGNNTKVYDA